jgi:hypothetical protein
MENVQELLQKTEAEIAAENTKASGSLDPREFASILVSTKINSEKNGSGDKDAHARLLEVMHSAPVHAIMQASDLFAQKMGIPRQQALQQIVESFKELDNLWSQVLLKEGLARLSSQYH